MSKNAIKELIEDEGYNLADQAGQTGINHSIFESLTNK
jgi:hypothetical protein